MEIRFTKHARDRLRERNIKIRHVTRTITDPDITSIEGEKTAVYKKFDSLALKVVYREEEGKIVVITLHWLELTRLEKVKPILKGEKA